MAERRKAGGAWRAPALGAAAVAAAAAAAFNIWKSRRAEAEHPPQGRFVEIGGVRLHYAEAGRGEPVVLIHGVGALVEDWESSGVFARLAERHRVIAFDRPGYGYSERPRTTIWTAERQAFLLSRALDRLGVGPATVVGHSWGTLVAAAIALNHPERARALVLLGGPLLPDLRADVLLAAGPAIPGIGDLERFTVTPLLARAAWGQLVKKLFAPAPVSPSFRRFPKELAVRPGHLRAAAADAALMIPSARALSPRYGELRLPTVVVHGDGDRIVPFSHAERFVAQVDGARLVRLDGIGHMLHHSRPDAVLDAVGRVAA